MAIGGSLKRVASILCGASLFWGVAGPGHCAGRPNILLILVDDMGYSDLGSYGGEIYTQNIDELAAQGFRFTNFHTSAFCAPTRSMLLTGQDNHKAGLGNMSELLADNQRGQPGYEGFLNGQPTIAALLRADGYHTYMAGKWHLGKSADKLPVAQGFEESVVLAEGGGDNFENKSYTPGYASLHYYEGAKPIDLPKDFYSTQFYTDKMLGYIDAHANDGSPFFGYLAFQAVHQPHQAPTDFIERYAHVYDAGWTAIGDVRRRRQLEIGLLPPGAREPTPAGPDWSALSDDEKRMAAKRMAVYAGMVEYVDMSVGRIVEHLRAKNLLDDTIILFLSDNGGESAELMKMFPDYYAKNFDLSYERLGQKGSYSEYGPGWASVSMTPFSNFKGSAAEGGVRAPLIIRYPQKFAVGRTSGAFLSVADITPTLLELAGARAPSADPKAFLGVSMVPLLTQKADDLRAGATFAQEVAGGAAVYGGDYKLVRNAPPFGDFKWRLYDLKKDPTESIDLSGQDPQRVDALRAAYADYVRANGVVEVPDDYAVDAQLKKNMQRGK
ncbi:arylsulfatase [Methylocella silvestris]|nr:arylsulfatase [Methylocella silvestris]